jgi:hypothetical protein
MIGLAIVTSRNAAEMAMPAKAAHADTIAGFQVMTTSRCPSPSDSLVVPDRLRK